MLETLSQLLRDSWTDGLEALQSLLPVAAFFRALGMLVKRGAVFTDMRRAAAETGLNLKIPVLQ